MVRYAMIDSKQQLKDLMIWYIACIVLSVLTLTDANAIGGDKSCCPESVPFNRTHHCQDGVKPRLNCTTGTTPVLVDPVIRPDDAFTVDVENGILILHSKEYTEFCCNEMKLADDNLHGVAVVCMPLEYPDEENVIHFFAIAELVSSVFLLATAFVYIYLKELRDIQGICVLHFVLNLSMTFLILVTLQFTTQVDSQLLCMTQAHCLYFFSLCAFFWMNINSFNTWKSAKGWYTTDRKILTIYASISYGFPTFFLIVTIVAQNVSGNHPKPDFGEIGCWFKDNNSRLYYHYFPMTVLLILNILYFLDSGRILWNSYRGQRQIGRIKSLRYKFCLYLKLYLIMGISWSFEILSATVMQDFEIVVLITDIINTLQGIIIFIVLIATRKRVLRLLAKKKLFNSDCYPRSWSRGTDIETNEETEEDVEVTLHSRTHT